MLAYSCTCYFYKNQGISFLLSFYPLNFYFSGRCTWLNPNKALTEDFDEDEDFEEFSQEVPQETGPQLLSSVGNDKGVYKHPAWTVALTSTFAPEYGLCVMKSNHWPGACAISNGKAFENVYIGWGKKYVDFSPLFPPASMDQFEHTEDVLELDDPTVEQEEEAKMLEEEANKSADEIENVEEEDD